MTVRLPRKIYENLRHRAYKTRRPMNELVTEALNETQIVTAELYGQICDAIERAYQGLPPLDTDDPFLHTSAEARRAAMRILDILGLDMEDPRASQEITR